jgi:hypothetical protein
MNMLNITVTDTDEDGFRWEIPVNEQFNGVTITSISQYVTFDPGDTSSDMAVNWNTSGLTDNPQAEPTGLWLMRNINSQDEITHVMKQFYFEHGWHERLNQLLLAAGFSADAVHDVDGSEWGMQAPGRASYDAYDCAVQARAHVMHTA